MSQLIISTNRRLLIWYAVVIFVIIIIIFRLFYLQIIRHDYYQKAARNDQLKQYTIVPERGLIKAYQGADVVPLVLNQKLYTLYADPSLVKDSSASAAKLAPVINRDTAAIKEVITRKNTRYAVLAKRLDEKTNAKILALKLPGIGSQGQDYRVYPQGSLAAQVLGFVNDEGQGRYGIEQQFDARLRGKAGLLKAITDVNGVPLAASRDNIQIDPIPGEDYVLTIDLAMQRQVENILKQGLERVGSQSGSVVLMDPYTGEIKALANYPTYEPGRFYEVKDPAKFNNPAVSAPLEVGSIMKALTVATGLNEGVITPESSYTDPGYITIDGATIKNVSPIPTNPTTIKDVLSLSLNTGAVHVLKQLGGGELNKQGRIKLHSYLTNNYRLGYFTGIEQPNEGKGTVPDPISGYGINLQYANMTFGQGMTATILQMGSAFSSIVNGGTYFKPHLIQSRISKAGKATENKPYIIKKNVIKPQVSKQLKDLLKYVYVQNYKNYRTKLYPGYAIGGKTGTGQIANPEGGYKEGEYNGTYVGFIGGDKPEYVAAVLVNTPNLKSYEFAGSRAAAPIFGSIADMLINNFGVEPAS